LDGLQEPLRRGLPKGKEYESWHLALDTVEAKLKVASERDQTMWRTAFLGGQKWTAVNGGFGLDRGGPQT